MNNMRVKYIGLFLGVSVTASTVFVACKSDFLKQDTIGVLTEAEAQSAKGARQFLTSTYAALKGSGWDGGISNWVYGSIVGGDANKGSDAGDQADIVPIQQYTATPTNAYFNTKWRALYEGIARANATIRVTNKLGDADITADEKKQILAQSRFLRGFYHFEAKKLWNNIPFVDETINASNAKLSNTKDWTKIMEDLDYARKNLNEVQDQVGKVNKWAAEAFYAKALLFQGKYAEALPIFTGIIQNGKTSKGLAYNLAPSFHDLFNADKDNAPEVRAESVFAYEASINDGSGGLNANYDMILNFPYNGGPGGCCGFFQPSFELANSFRTMANGLPFLDGTYNSATNELATDQGIESSGSWKATDKYKKNDFTVRIDPANPNTEQAYKSLVDDNTGNDPLTSPAAWKLAWVEPTNVNLDPRIDWTIGRRGVPYLDWGTHPGKAWIRDQGNGGPYAPKKNVYYKAQEGKLTDGTNWTSGLTATNYKIMRFADVLLMAAEAEVEAGSLEKAREYVNRVRTRAAAAHVKDANGNDAAKYVIDNYKDAWTDKEMARQAVRFERKLELAMEGHRFFDLVRWGIADQVLNAFLVYENSKIPAGYGNGSAKFTKNKNEYFPIPQRQIDLSSTNGASSLTQNPGYQ